MRVIGLALVLVLSVLVSCASPGGSRPIIAAPERQAISDEKYKIGPGDVLAVSVWGSPELTLDVPVRPDGYISLPLVGDVKADGIDAATLAMNITSSLEAQLRNPQVTVIVTQINSAVYVSRVRVTGAVNRPVSLPYGKGMSVLDLVLEAGGLNGVAAGNKTKLYREIGGKLSEVQINLDDILLRGRMETNFPLQPGDVLTVPERLF